MDIYRFFHPHHNPRLHSTPIRQQELSELEQAASELLKALERTVQRTRRRPVPPIFPQHFTDIMKAMRFVVRSLQTVCDAHPGDGPGALRDIAQERSELSGWEAWTRLVREQLASEDNFISPSSGNGHHNSGAQHEDDGHRAAFDDHNGNSYNA